METLCLPDSGSCFNPTLVRRQPDAVALGEEPQSNCLDRLVARCEHLEDITGRPVFSVLLALGVRHFHENVINVALGRDKAQRCGCSGRVVSPFQRPACRDVSALLMDGLGRERGFRSGEETGTKDDE